MKSLLHFILILGLCNIAILSCRNRIVNTCPPIPEKIDSGCFGQPNCLLGFGEFEAFFRADKQALVAWGFHEWDTGHWEQQNSALRVTGLGRLEPISCNINFDNVGNQDFQYCISEFRKTFGTIKVEYTFEIIFNRLPNNTFSMAYKTLTTNPKTALTEMKELDERYTQASVGCFFPNSISEPFKKGSRGYRYLTPKIIELLRKRQINDRAYELPDGVEVF